MAVPQEKFVIGNWKMNLLVSDSVALASGIKEQVANLEGVNNGAVQVWIAPSYFAVPAVIQAVKGSAVKVGIQNICGAEKGAFTGEVSALMLKDVGATFSLIGHSERRNVFEESNQQIALRVKGALTQGITPVFCIGENLSERESGKTNTTLSSQLEAVLPTLNEDEIKKIIIAYEPVWAIGTGKTATPAMIQETHQFILERSAELGAKKIRGLLYGGSVTPENFSEILSVPGVHGGLVGGASLKVENFLALVKAASL
jgi:triosephosphate isomerase